MKLTTDDLRIESLHPVISPAVLMEEFPVSDAAQTLISNARNLARDIVQGKDKRLIVVVGPCSIHDPKAALEYAQKLVPLIKQHENELCIIMRAYFEKPRTRVGWKGLINDPLLDGSFAINKGLRVARKLLYDIAELGVPTGTEYLDTIIPQYIADLISWGAIGARTTESQVHRELASGLSMPVGFKNGTSGDVQIAIDAIVAARYSHHFLSVTKEGAPAIVSTKGNDACHVILRGSNTGPNYDPANIKKTAANLAQAGLPQRMMVDCSHGNSGKDPNRQPAVAMDIANQIKSGSEFICGVMIESHLFGGTQAQVEGQALKYGISITDACLAWDATVPVLETLAEAIRHR